MERNPHIKREKEEYKTAYFDRSTIALQLYTHQESEN